MPCQSISVNGKLLAGCRKKKPSGEPGTPVSQGKEIRAGEVYVARSASGCRTNTGELFRAGRGTGSFGEQPKPRVTARTDVFRLSFRPMSGFGHAACRSGRKRTPGRDSPCAKVQVQDSESPFTHVRDCREKPTA